MQVATLCEKVGLRLCAFLVVLAFIGVRSDCVAQVAFSLDEIEQLDSLMFSFDFPSVEEAIEMKERRAAQRNLSVDDAFVAQQRRYRRVYQTVEGVIARDDDFVKSYVVSRLSENYDFVNAGLRGSEVFEDFRTAVSDFQYRDAVAMYEVAKYFKTLHVMYLREMLEDHYYRARTKLDAQDHDGAQQILDSVKVYFDSKNSFHRVYLDSLAILSGDVAAAAAFSTQQNDMWGRKQKVSLRGGLVLTGAVIQHGAPELLSVSGFDSVRDVKQLKETGSGTHKNSFLEQKPSCISRRELPWVLTSRGVRIHGQTRATKD